MVCEIPRLAGVRSDLAAVDPAEVASEGVLRNWGLRPTGQETGGLRVWLTTKVVAVRRQVSGDPEDPDGRA